jgi:alpha-tubulin suppressor-like RCC1 family protein
LITDSKNRVYKTGMKIDYTPKMIKFDSEILPPSKIAGLACGRAHYVVFDSDNNLHTNGKIFKQKSEIQHDGFEVHDGDELFEGCKVKQLSMDYEIFGALVEDK